PGQDAIGSIKVQASTLIWLNHGLGLIAKKLIEVVQVSESLRMRVRRVQSTAPDLIAAGDLKFAIKIVPAVGQGENARRPESNRRQDQLMACITLLITNTEQKIANQFPVHFDVPDLTTRVFESVGNHIQVRCRVQNPAEWIESHDCTRRQMRKR